MKSRVFACGLLFQSERYHATALDYWACSARIVIIEDKPCLIELDMSSICLLLFCGLPGAGKTSFARSIRTILHKHGAIDIPDPEASSSGTGQWQCLHVSYDELLPSAVEKCLIESGHKNEHVSRHIKCVCIKKTIYYTYRPM